MSNITDIKQRLLAVIDIMRRKYSLEESTEYALKFLLFKRLLDQSNEELPAETHSSTKEHDLAKQLADLSVGLKNSYPNIGDIFTYPKGSFWSGFDEVTLRHVITILTGLNLSDEELKDTSDLAEACESLIEEYAKRAKHKREVYTPRQIARMLVELINPKQGMWIYDPVCGFGEILAASAWFIKKSDEDLSQIALFGQSRLFQECAIAKVNLILHGITEPDIRVGNAIIEPQLVKNDEPIAFDAILTNPPFGFKLSQEDYQAVKNDNRFPYGVPPRSGDAVYLFVQHVLSSLKPTGKAAMILPRGVLFRGGFEQEIRRRIIESDQIEAVIELPPNLFYSTSIPVVIVLFNKSKTEKGRILLIDARREYATERGQNDLQPQHINRIVSTYSDLKVDTEFSTLVSIEDIAANEYDLSIDRYFIQSLEQLDPTAEIDCLHQLEARRSELENSIDTHLRALGVEL